jgi:sugar lactone lactonase YvrE
MRLLIAILLVGVLPAIAYLLFWPVPIDPVAWQAPRSTGYSGPYAPNERLASISLVDLGTELGPEHIAFGPDGRLYTGVLSGAILVMDRDGRQVATFARTGGRPLGLDFDASGRLIVADALKGLLAIDPDGTIRTLVEQAGGEPLRYADAVVVADDGRLIFTDASRRMDPRRWGTFDAALLDVLEQSCTGRVLVHDPSTGRTETLLDDLCFPNGVALSGDQRHVFVAETGRYRIWKVDVLARNLSTRGMDPDGTGAAQVIVDNLPGFPDNLTRSADGRLWTGLTKPRSPLIDRMAPHPWLRSVVLRLPRALWPVPPAYGHVIAFDEDGRVVADLQDPAGRLPETSGATEHQGRLYVQSLHAASLGYLDLAAAGL